MNSDGERFNGTITEIGDKDITVDLNHPFAGKPLHFIGRVTENRPATNEEIKQTVEMMTGGCGGCSGKCGDCGGCSGGCK